MARPIGPGPHRQAIIFYDLSVWLLETSQLS